MVSGQWRLVHRMGQKSAFGDRLRERQTAGKGDRTGRSRLFAAINAAAISADKDDLNRGVPYASRSQDIAQENTRPSGVADRAVLPLKSLSRRLV